MIRLVANDNEPAATPEKTIEIVELSEEEQEKRRRLSEAHARNSDWLQGQWGRLAPHCLGKYVAVAEQEAFIADTGEEARRWIEEKHPGDPGAFVQYVLPVQGPRIYANQRCLAAGG